MDEVDGMSAGDRGGVADLIQTIAKAKIPIIAICNDKYHQKLKSLRNHCLELEYRCAVGVRTSFRCHPWVDLPSEFVNGKCCTSWDWC